MEDLPTPASFNGDTPPERIMGSEWEGIIQSVNLEERADARAFLAPKTLAANLEGLTFQQSGSGGDRIYLSNGAKIYPDCGNTEYASAEAAGPVDAAAADLAGIAVLGAVIEASGLPYRGLFRTSGATAIDASGDIKNNSSGYHTNYLLGREPARDPVTGQLVLSHLTSNVWAKAGALQEGGFVFSQKADGLGGDAIEYRPNRRTVHGDKPMAMFRLDSLDNDVTAANEGWTRVEVRSGDPGLSPTAKYLEFATMSLILRMAEHSKMMSGQNVSQWTPEHPAEAAKTFSRDLTLSQTVPTIEGKRVTALDIQDALAEAAIFLSGKIEIPPSERLALSLWPAINDGLRQSRPDQIDYPKIIYDTVNFAPKHRYLARHHTEEELATLAPEAVQRSLMWDRVMPRGTGLQYWTKVGSPVVSAEAIQERTHQAPTATRAHIRAAVITNPDVQILDINWRSVDYAVTPGTSKEIIDLSNPYRTHANIFASANQKAA